jgi:hypothetical protein
MAIKGNLQNKIYRDRRTGVKRRWMEYSKVERWLSVRDKVTDWAPAFVAFFSIVFALFFFMVANINNTTDGETRVVDSDNDKQFDNPWDMNDGQFSFTFGNTYDEGAGKENRIEAIYGLGIPSIKSNESVDSNPSVDGIENEMIANEWFRSFPEISAIDYVVFGVISLMLPYGVYGYRRDKIRSRVEEKFPDFLRDLAEYWKGGQYDSSHSNTCKR